MKIKLFKLTVIIISLLIFKVSFGQDAEVILSKMDKVIYFAKDKQENVTLTIENLKNGKITTKKGEVFEKDGKKLFRYTCPKADSGISSLTASENETYIYLPLFNMVKKITNTSNMGNLNKSDFSLSDKPSKSYSDSYSPELINSTTDSYVLKLTPKDDKIPFKKLVVYVDKKHYFPRVIEYFDKKGEKLKTADYHFITVGGHYVADKIVMTNNQKQSRTTIIMSNIRINKGLPDSMFDKENLKKKKNK